MAQGITEHLLDFATWDVPADAAAMMRLSLFDWAACGIAGGREDEFAGFKTTQMGQGAGPASLLGGGHVPAATAALVNGTLSHALDYDDTHFAHIGHPSVAVLPAVIALGEDRGIALSQIVEAATIGVEASVLVGLWLGRDHYQIGYHQTATAGAFGATLAACRLLSLSKDQTRQALGLCASMASGIKAQFGTMAKPLNAGLAARSGVEAALWAQSGMTAACDGLAGPLGFGATHHGSDSAVSLPQGAWHILSISHKFHACCHGLHAMLEALGQAACAPNDIATLHIRTHPRWMSVCNIASPQTGLEAKFSYAQTAAMTVLGHETGSIASYTDAITQDADILALRSKIEVSQTDHLSETQAEVTITLRDGNTHDLSHDLMAPMTLDTRAAKLRKKTSALLSAPRADTLWKAAQGDTLRDLTDQLVMS
ncbi:MAG: MmgE/PrpD family protein [Sulfitobacter sp.]